MTTPEPILAALRHVQQFHPEVVQVFYSLDARWRFTDLNNKAPTFAPEVDVDILEDAADAVPYLPYAASLP